MGSITIRVRSMVWFVTGALLATTVTLMFVTAWRVDAAPGDDDATFVPITPCRLADTRPAPNRVGPAAALGSEETQPFAVHGSNGECSIPSEAVAVALNVTALGASAPSFLTFWPSGERPLASSMNPAPGQPPTPNAVTVDLSGAGGFNVFNRAGSVNVVIDVTGYYVQSSLTELANRLAAVEAAAATNTAGIATNTSGIASNTSGIATNTSDIAGLDDSQPFAIGARRPGGPNLSVTLLSETVVVSVPLTAPVSGQVTVSSTVNVVESTAGDTVSCSITTGPTIDPAYIQEWESSGSDGSIAQLSGTRTFDVAAETTTSFGMVCEPGGFSADVRDPVITAIFTPTP